jgi:hypothetical protein
LAIIILPFYVIKIYDQFFEHEIGYIYDPSTSVLYKTESRVIPGPNKWKYLLPFVRPEAASSFMVLESTSIAAMLRERDETTDVSEKRMYAKIEEIMLEIETKSTPMTFGEHWWRSGPPPIELLPPEWKSLGPYMLDHSSKVQVFLADAVIANWISRDREPTEYGEPKEFDILRFVLVLNGYAA